MALGTDGGIMPTNPLPDWFARQFNLTSEDMFPEAQRPAGTVAAASGGHHVSQHDTLRRLACNRPSVPALRKGRW